MDSCTDRISIAAFLIGLTIAMPTPGAFAQQAKASNSAAASLSSIGMTQPGFVKAPDFNLRDAAGGTISLSAHRGNWVLLNFWATWCGPCREEMPSMEHLSRNFAGQGLTVLAVNQRESSAQVNNFMRQHGLNFTVPLDTDGRVSNSYRVFGIPATYLIDGNGQVIGMKAGSRDWASRAALEVFRKLLGDSGAAAAGGLILEPAAPLPLALRVKAAGARVHSQQDDQTEILVRLSRDEETTPIAQASGAGESWYMVRTKSGVIGWIRAGDVEEVRRAK